MVFLFLVLAALLPPSSPKAWFETLVHAYAVFYFWFWYQIPLIALGLLLIAFLLSHMAFALFDFITLRIWAFGNSLLAYAALLLVGYAVMLTVVLFLSSFIPYIVSGSDAPKDIWQFLSKAINTIPSMFADASKPAEGEDDWGPGIALLMLTGVLGTAAICFSAIFAITSLNLLYAASLGLLKIDSVLRGRFKWSQGHILERPVDYIAAVSAVLVFVVTWVVNFAWVLSSALL